MKKIFIFLAIFIACEENKESEDSLPIIEVTETSVVQAGGGLLPITYHLAFKGNIINPTEEVFKTFRQSVLFKAENGNQVDAQIGLPLFRWLCPDSSLLFAGKSNDFAEGYIDSIVSYVPVDIGLVVVYGQGDECDKN